jgi:hypothetical protein
MLLLPLFFTHLAISTAWSPPNRRTGQVPPQFPPGWDDVCRNVGFLDFSKRQLCDDVLELYRISNTVALELDLRYREAFLRCRYNAGLEWQFPNRQEAQNLRFAGRWAEIGSDIGSRIVVVNNLSENPGDALEVNDPDLAYWMINKVCREAIGNSF